MDDVPSSNSPSPIKAFRRPSALTDDELAQLMDFKGIAGEWDPSIGRGQKQKPPQFRVLMAVASLALLASVPTSLDNVQWSLAPVAIAPATRQPLGWMAFHDTIGTQLALIDASAVPVAERVIVAPPPPDPSQIPTQDWMLIARTEPPDQSPHSPSSPPTQVKTSEAPFTAIIVQGELVATRLEALEHMDRAALASNLTSHFAASPNSGALRSKR